LPTAGGGTGDRFDGGARRLGWQSDRGRRGAESGLARPGRSMSVRLAVRGVGLIGRGCDRPVADGERLRRACGVERLCWGSCRLGPDPGFGRVARAAAALEGLDDDHAAAAARAWRALVDRRRGSAGRLVAQRFRLTDATENATTSNLAPLPRQRVRSLTPSRLWSERRAGDLFAPESCASLPCAGSKDILRGRAEGGGICAVKP